MATKKQSYKTKPFAEWTEEDFQQEQTDRFAAYKSEREKRDAERERRNAERAARIAEREAEKAAAEQTEAKAE